MKTAIAYLVRVSLTLGNFYNYIYTCNSHILLIIYLDVGTETVYLLRIGAISTTTAAIKVTRNHSLAQVTAGATLRGTSATGRNHKLQVF